MGMRHSAFKTNPISLEELLRHCGAGHIQLPDFQRSWVWDEDRIKSLIASVSQAFPVGALMTLEMKAGGADAFARRPVQGAPAAAEHEEPGQLLLDGQQRMTSLYQTCMRREVVTTVTPRQKRVRRWFYLDMAKALRADIDREEAILGVPEDRRLKSDFDRVVDLDLSTPELEYEHMMFPLNRAFDWDEWQDGFTDYWLAKGEVARRDIFRQFKNAVLQNFKSYQVPVIALAPETSHAAVCLVFEKVNTGGKPLDAFELVTAMYAAQGYRLRDDWLGDPKAPDEAGMYDRLRTYARAPDQKFGVLEKIASTDVLQAISLLHTACERERAIDRGVKESDLPAVRATRQSLLDLPLAGYLRHREEVEEGFRKVVRFLHQKHIYRALDLPYQGQLVPFAAVLAKIGDKWEHGAVREKIEKWYWCGIFGELYGAGSEARFAKDIVEIPAWIDGGPEPSTVRDGVFRVGRLETLRTRQSAAYKGVHALLMGEGAKDFRSGQGFSHTAFFDEAVDIHHIFPQSWCSKNGIDPKRFDTIVNKTPLAYRTNRIIGGGAPSRYLARLEDGAADTPPLGRDMLDACLRSHAIEPELLRADDFDAFLADRSQRLLALISRATGHPLVALDAAPEEGDDVGDTDIVASVSIEAEQAY
mgnify:CR=1 FL=1